MSKSDIGGVWRTIGGRRVFIKDGQDLATAMKESGKFKKKDTDEKEKNGIKEISYVGQDNKVHKMNSYDYPKDRDAYHKHLTDKYGTYKEEDIIKKDNSLSYAKLRNDFYEKGNKDSINYRDKITDVAKNSKEDNVTLDVETGKPVNFEKGYSVSFQQSTDNYTDEEYAEKIAECRDKCDGKVYAGKYGGDAEASFHTDNIDDAKELMYKYNQESIYDWENETLIMNDKYDASKNQTNYKEEKTANDIMNDKIREKAGKKTFKEDLPKETEIKTQGTSNRKEVSENIQAHILDYYDNPQDFVEQMENMNEPTMWRAGETLAKGGSYMIYYDEQRDFLNSLKINPKGKSFSDDRVFQTYTSLIGRESAKLYERIKKNEYRKYLFEHPGSDMSFSEFKNMKKGGK